MFWTKNQRMYENDTNLIFWEFSVCPENFDIFLKADFF
jgi:hypothetical protein